MDLEFLDAGEPAKAEAQAVETPVVETPPAEAPQEPPQEAPVATEPKGPVRGPDGKFAKRDEEPVMVPLAALHETRDKVRSLEAQLTALQPQPQQSAVPDMFEDPDGFQSHLASQVNGAVLNATLNLSEEMVRGSSGNELVDAAQEWGKTAFQANPGLFQQFLAQRNPYGFLVQQYQRDQSLTKLGDDPKEIDAYLAWKQAQQAIQQPPAQAVPQQSPPVSIASAPSAGGAQHVAVGPGVAFDNIIGT